MNNSLVSMYKVLHWQVYFGFVNHWKHCEEWFRNVGHFIAVGVQWCSPDYQKTDGVDLELTVLNFGFVLKLRGRPLYGIKREPVPVKRRKRENRR